MRHEHTEALALARRLEQADLSSAAQDRRALLLYWYGTGASHLRQEQQLLLAAWERHGGAAIAEIATQSRPSPAALQRVGRDLAAHIHRQDGELRAVVRLCAIS